MSAPANPPLTPELIAKIKRLECIFSPKAREQREAKRAS